MKRKESLKSVFEAIVDTPLGSRIKYKYDVSEARFRVSKILPLGLVFPFNFGFFPSTEGEDGDPLDVLILMTEPLLPGTLVNVRLLGNLSAKQREKTGKVLQNDRLIAVMHYDPSYENVSSIEDLEPKLLSQIEHFFVTYNEELGKKFFPLKREPVDKATALVTRMQKEQKAKRQAA